MDILLQGTRKLNTGTYRTYLPTVFCLHADFIKHRFRTVPYRILRFIELNIREPLFLYLK